MVQIRIDLTHIYSEFPEIFVGSIDIKSTRIILAKENERIEIKR